MEIDDGLLDRALERRVRLSVWKQIVEPRLRLSGSLETLADASANGAEGPELNLDLSRLSAEQRQRVDDYTLREMRYQAWVILAGRRQMPAELCVDLHRELQEPLRDVQDALLEIVRYLEQALRRTRERTGALRVWDEWGHPGPLALLADDPRLAALFDCLDGLLVRGTGASIVDVLESLTGCLDGEADDLWEDQLAELREYVTR